MILNRSFFLLVVGLAAGGFGCAPRGALADGREATRSNNQSHLTNAPPTCSNLNTACSRPADPDGPGASAWAFIDETGMLAYGTLSQGGDRLLDFSYAGYAGGGVAIPFVATQQTVGPSGDDDTGAIQAAIDAVSLLSPGDDGFRGAVQLSQGTFTLQGSLSIRASGVVLRGSGSGPDGSILMVAGNPRALISIQGSGSWATSGGRASIVDDYVASGSNSFTVDDASGFAVGMAVLVDRPVTDAWVQFMGMDHLVRSGQPQTWIRAGTLIHSDRVITAINGNQITVDAPISDSFDAQYVQPGATMVRYTFNGRLAQVGLEHLSVIAPPVPTPISQPIFSLLSVRAVINGWVRDVVAQDFINGLSIDNTSKWITIEDTAFTHTVPADTTAGAPADYGIGGQQILVHRSSSQGDHWWSVVTQATQPGPNVVLNFTASGNSTNLSPHQRWATALLLDNVYTPSGGIDFQDRGNAGSGQGWSIGFGVVWNSTANTFLIQQPPGSTNWAIGSSGRLT